MMSVDVVVFLVVSVVVVDGEVGYDVRLTEVEESVFREGRS